VREYLDRVQKQTAFSNPPKIGTLTIRSEFSPTSDLRPGRDQVQLRNAEEVNGRRKRSVLLVCWHDKILRPSVSNPLQMSSSRTLCSRTVIEFRGPAVGVAGDSLRGFQGAVIFQKILDPGRPERVGRIVSRQPRLFEPSLEHVRGDGEVQALLDAIIGGQICRAHSRSIPELLPKLGANQKSGIGIAQCSCLYYCVSVSVADRCIGFAPINYS
jgi:hypothetical protein